MGALVVRRATVDDADAIAVVHVQAWREAYAHLLSAAYLDGLEVERRAEHWRQIIDSGTVDVAVAVDRDAVIGWANVSQCEDVDAPRDRELAGIYILAGSYGSGADQALLDAVLGHVPAFLWVAEHNQRAEAFYRRNGFRRDGTAKVLSLNGPVGVESLAAVRLVR